MLLGTQEILVLLISVINNIWMKVIRCDSTATLSPAALHPNVLGQSMETPGS